MMLDSVEHVRKNKNTINIYCLVIVIPPKDWHPFSNDLQWPLNNAQQCNSIMSILLSQKEKTQRFLIFINGQ